MWIKRGSRARAPPCQSAACGWGGTWRGAGAAAKPFGSRLFGSQQKPSAALGRGAKRRVVPGRTTRRSAAAPALSGYSPAPGASAGTGRGFRSLLGPVAQLLRGAGGTPAHRDLRLCHGKGVPEGGGDPELAPRAAPAPCVELAPPKSGTCLARVSPASPGLWLPPDFPCRLPKIQAAPKGGTGAPFQLRGERSRGRGASLEVFSHLQPASPRAPNHLGRHRIRAPYPITKVPFNLIKLNYHASTCHVGREGAERQVQDEHGAGHRAPPLRATGRSSICFASPGAAGRQQPARYLPGLLGRG